MWANDALLTLIGLTLDQVASPPMAYAMSGADMGSAAASLCTIPYTRSQIQYMTGVSSCTPRFKLRGKLTNASKLCLLEANVARFSTRVGQFAWGWEPGTGKRS